MWLIFIGLTTPHSLAQNDSTSVDTSSNDTIDLSFVDEYDQQLIDHFKLLHCFTTDTGELNFLKLPEDSIPVYTDEEYIDRIKNMDEKSPFEFKVNDAVLAMVKHYVYKRPRLTSRMLGLAELYFPLFEEKLSTYNLPMELKYLPIVESALNPAARSHAGAGGLWQFMPATGESYGLDITSYLDERSDPYLSTEAACQHLSKLYKMYGDWAMSIAAYNAGSGNVNKAIRRSGGKTDYWGIREFLPRETQNYVPIFIAVNYLMEYAAYHNVYPRKPEFFNMEIDTVHVAPRLDLGVVEHWTGYSRTKLHYLNPMLKLEVLPKSETYSTFYLPVSITGKFIAFEDSIYKYSSLEHKYWVAQNEPARTQKTHIIQSGETLYSIAKKYDCTIQQLKAWNRKSSNIAKKGRKLTIFTPIASSSSTSKTYTNSTSKPKPKPVVLNEGAYRYYIIQKGDTLWDIAQKFSGVSVNDIKVWNSHIDSRSLHTGDKVKIAK